MHLITVGEKLFPPATIQNKIDFDWRLNQQTILTRDLCDKVTKMRAIILRVANKHEVIHIRSY